MLFAIAFGTARAGCLRVLLCSATALTITGCPSTCDSIGIAPTYRILVFDESTGEPICDADVFVNDDAATKSQGRCDYWHQIPPGPSAKIRAQRESYVPATKEVSTDYEVDECDHPIERRAEIGLTRKP